MKKIFVQFLFVILLSLILSSNTKAQEKINYGSNKGKYVRINNTNIYFEDYGKGIPLVLLHGGLQSIHDFQEVIPELSKQYRVIAFDRPCHGRSEHTDTLSYHLMAEYTSMFIDKLNLDSVYLLGWSDGASTALLTASLLPDKVKKLIVCSADMNNAHAGSQPPENLTRITPEFVEHNWHDWLATYKTLTPEPGKWKQFISTTITMWLRIDFITEHEMEQLQCKTLVVSGDKDFIKPETTVKIHRLIPNSRLCILPNTTHFIFAERSELISKLALEFFK